MNKNIFKFCCVITAFTIQPAFADGQSVPINYDDFSFFEEPLAVAIGPATLNANLLADQAVEYNLKTEEDTYNSFVAGNFKFETELPNSWQVGVQYFSRLNRLGDDKYSDNLALFVSDEWGILSLGNVTQSVAENVRRDRGVGNAFLANNNFLGQLDEAGLYYAVKFNSYLFSATADKEGYFETGLNFERPIGINNYILGARFRRGNLSENSKFGLDADTYGGTLIGEYIHGSLLYDAQIGYENIDYNLTNTNDGNNHIFGSLGTRYQYGAYNFSLEGGLGRFNNMNRRSVAFGSRFDMARGLSLNAGINYIYENEDDEIKTIGSIRYEL